MAITEIVPERAYFTIIPNFVDDMNLSIYARGLYLHLKRVAGEGGKCYQSTKQIAEHCQIGVASVCRAKKELVDAGLITVEHTTNPLGGSGRDQIRIVDVWMRNVAAFSSQDDRVPEKESQSSVPESQDSKGECQGSTEESKRRTKRLKEEPNTKEEPIFDSLSNSKLSDINNSPNGELFIGEAENDDLPFSDPPVQEQGPEGSPPVNRKQLFALVCAIAEVTHMDRQANNGRLFAEAKRLAGAEIVPTPDMIRRYYGPDSWWYQRHWKGRAGQLPTPGDIRASWGQWQLPQPVSRAMASLAAYVREREAEG